MQICVIKKYFLSLRRAKVKDGASKDVEKLDHSYTDDGIAKQYYFGKHLTVSQNVQHALLLL
jgi:hypothetical protein